MNPIERISYYENLLNEATAVLKQYETALNAYVDIQHKITDLTKLEKFDPFNGLEVKYSGIAPYGTAEIDYDGDDLDVSDFDCDNTENLKNGDKVTVFLSDTDMEDYIEMFDQVRARINSILDSLPDDKVSEKYEASALRDYTQTLININRLIDDSRKGESYGNRRDG